MATTEVAFAVSQAAFGRDFVLSFNGDYGRDARILDGFYERWVAALAGDAGATSWSKGHWNGMFERNPNRCADAICRRGVNSLKDALMILTDERVMYDRRKRDEDARRQASLCKQDSDVAKKVIHTDFEELEVPPRRFPPNFPAHKRECEGSFHCLRVAHRT